MYKPISYVFRRRLPAVWLAVILVSFLTPASALAQAGTPAWKKNLKCDWGQKFQGIQYCTGKEPHTNVQVIVIDLKDPGVRMEYLIVNGIDKFNKTGVCKDVNRASKGLGGPGCDDPNKRQYYPVMSLDDAVSQAKQRYQKPGVAVVINGDYSACTDGLDACKVDKNGYPNYREHGPEGLTVVNGIRLDGKSNFDGDNNAVNRPWLAVSKDPPLQAMIGQLNSDEGKLPNNWIHTGMGGAPWLIQDGDVIEWKISSCFYAPGSCYDGASQTAVGLTQDGRWLYLVIANKHKTLLDLAQFMRNQLDAWQAIKFDGGGSTKLWYGGSTIFEDKPRLITNYLVVLAESGSGIVLPAGSDVTPTSGSATCPPTNCTKGQDVSRDYFVQVVQNLKDVPMSNFAVDALVAWEPFEGTGACWNPLATTWKMNPVCNFNTKEVQSFQNQAMGVTATGNTLNLSYYDAIRRMLRHEAFDREALRKSLGTWGTCQGAKCDPLLNSWLDLYQKSQVTPTTTITPPGAQEPPFWEDLQKELEQWWQAQWTKIQAQFEAWLQTQVQKLLQQLGQTLENSTKQVCGSLVFPAVLVSSLWFWRRNRSAP